MCFWPFGRLFLSTLSLRRATAKISPNLIDRVHFYPRSPCGERPRRTYLQYAKQAFLSTLSLRRATICAGINIASDLEFLSTLSLRRATHNTKNNYTDYCDFYPRSPCGERPSMSITSNFEHTFLSTLSLRRATVHYDNYNLHCVISIHALLAESDDTPVSVFCKTRDFYPRSPCGERLAVPDLCKRDIRFLSTLSLRRATTGTTSAKMPR